MFRAQWHILKPLAACKMDRTGPTHGDSSCRAMMKTIMTIVDGVLFSKNGSKVRFSIFGTAPCEVGSVLNPCRCSLGYKHKNHPSEISPVIYQHLCCEEWPIGSSFCQWGWQAIRWRYREPWGICIKRIHFNSIQCCSRRPCAWIRRGSRTIDG